MAPEARFCPACGAAAGWSISRPTETHLRIGFGSGFRFGLGFFVAGALVGLILWLVSLALIGSLIAGFVGAVSGTGTSGSFRFDGAGTARSEPTQLSGDVDVVWTANSVSGQPCQHRGVVGRADSSIARETIVDVPVADASSGTYLLRSLPDTSYVIDVGSTCEWTFRLTPRR